jgi:hypothetical protein
MTDIQQLQNNINSMNNVKQNKTTFQNIMHAIVLLLGSNLLVGTVMSLIYYLGKNSILSSILIYLPIFLICIVSIRDKYSFSFIFSCVLAVMHAQAHVIYPFINEVIGVNGLVDVWQDQILHFFQSVLFSSIFFNKSNKLGKLLLGLFIMCNFLNVVAGYFCWNEQCHELYVAISIVPALSSGLHFATGSLFQNTQNVATYGFALQGFSSVLTYFMFKASDDILKLFALCRFFEIYFIAPHYIGYFYSRYLNYLNSTKESKPTSFVGRFLEVIGIYKSVFLNKSPSFMKYFLEYTTKTE